MTKAPTPAPWEIESEVIHIAPPLEVDTPWLLPHLQEIWEQTGSLSSVTLPREAHTLELSLAMTQTNLALAGAIMMAPQEA